MRLQVACEESGSKINGTVQEGERGHGGSEHAYVRTRSQHSQGPRVALNRLWDGLGWSQPKQDRWKAWPVPV